MNRCHLHSAAISLFVLIMFFFFFNDTATTEIYTLSLHDALPISNLRNADHVRASATGEPGIVVVRAAGIGEVQRVAAFQRLRSEEHTSELQSRQYLVCRLLLEKKKTLS